MVILIFNRASSTPENSDLGNPVFLGLNLFSQVSADF